ncbi:MAG: hypothetical protein RLP09_12645 [Sandaracinaceae bacterium]
MQIDFLGRSAALCLALGACGDPSAAHDAGRLRVLDSGSPTPPVVVCEGTADGCSALTPAECAGVPGCQRRGRCEGFTHCGHPDRASCERVRGCRWEMDLYCGGSAASCTGYASGRECESVGCAWVETDECQGAPPPCASLGASDCDRVPGCRRVGSSPDAGQSDGGGGGDGGTATDGGTGLAVAAMFGRAHHYCVLLNDGRLVCWGSNQHAKLGTGTPSMFEPPTVIDALDGVEEVAIGVSHTCARVGPDVWCWGSNANAQLFRGHAGGDSPTPERVEGVTATGVYAGYNTTCITEENVALCVGSQRGLSGRYISPETITTPTAWYDLDDVQAMSLGGADACALTTTGRVRCTLLSRESEAPFRVPEWEGAEQIVVGWEFACARKDGVVSCYGDNESGQLGDGTTTERYAVAPAEVPIPGTVVDVSAGFAFACAATSDGEVWCWGENRETQLATPDYPFRSTPAQIPELSGARDVECGTSHCCAWTGGLDVWCWGENDRGQTGISPVSGSSFAPPRPIPFDL